MNGWLDDKFGVEEWNITKLVKGCIMGVVIGLILGVIGFIGFNGGAAFVRALWGVQP